MKIKNSVVITFALISALADIITLTSAFKWVLINWFGMEEKDATSINTFVLVAATFVLLLTLAFACYSFYCKLKETGTHEIAIAIIPYFRYKVPNKNNTLLRALHSDLYHEVINTQNHIMEYKRQRRPEQQNLPIGINEVAPHMQTLMRVFHSVLYEVSHLDMSINVYLTGAEDGNTILTRSLFLRSKKEQNRGEQRQMNQKYIIHNCNNQNLNAFAINAKSYCVQNPNSNYLKNNIFDFILTTDNSSWLSNDLRIDEDNGDFFSSSSCYKRKYKFLAAFAIIPPSNGNNRANPIKGVLTFDTHNTRLFSEEECVMLMGLMAHQLYEVLRSLN